jgi:hypothetical protein
MPDIELKPEDLAERAGRLGIKAADLKLVAHGEPTVNVLIAGVPVQAKPHEGKITLSPPPEVGEGPWTVVVTTKTDKIIDVLAYDPKGKKFYAPADIIDDEDDQQLLLDPKDAGDIARQDDGDKRAPKS